MKKILIADDELLVRVGMQTMIDWSSYGTEICAVAHNGNQALQLIEQHRPDIVITDIKMPLLSGLELAETCRERYGELPLFILLTSYEEFDYVRQAMHLGVVDYLVKLELNPKTLGSSLEKALTRLESLCQTEEERTPSTLSFTDGLQPFEEKFFVRLYHDLFENQEQFRLQSEELNLDFSAPAYVVAACEIISMRHLNVQQQLTLCTGIIRMVRDSLEKFGACKLTSLDPHHFNVLFPYTGKTCSDLAPLASLFIPRMQVAVDTAQRYFSVFLRCGLGRAVSDPYTLAESAYSARLALDRADETCPIVAVHPDIEETVGLFDFSPFRAELARAFERMDLTSLHKNISRIIDQLRHEEATPMKARDAASGLLYMALALLPDGESILSQIFSDSPQKYRCIYKFRDSEQFFRWMEELRDALCRVLQTEERNDQQRVVEKITEYIRLHPEQRLSLREVAAAFNFSPNYVSQLFAKYAKCGFVETVTREKIDTAKKLMAHGDFKIYELAERLHYESAFYFSKVFKKETGMSPREYMKRQKR